jgi:hypothetical protein
MRALALVALAGCSGGHSSTSCTLDTQCQSGEVCARDEQCSPASQVRALKITWTIRGAPASATTCASSPSFSLWFDSPGLSFGFEPVPCMEGQFTIDKLPLDYDQVSLQLGRRTLAVGAIDASGVVHFDVAP